MRLEGSFATPHTPDQVQSFLEDLRRIGPCVPDLEQLDAASPHQATVKVKAGVGFVRGMMTLNLTSARAGNQIDFRGQGSGMNSAVDLGAGFRVLPQGDGSLVEWFGDANVKGVIASMGGGLLDQVARKTVREMIRRIEAALGAWDPHQEAV